MRPLASNYTPTPVSAGVIQEQPASGIVIPAPDENLIDPKTGRLKSVIASGSQGEATIPQNDVTTIPVTVTGYPDSKGQDEK